MLTKLSTVLLLASTVLSSPEPKPHHGFKSSPPQHIPLAKRLNSVLTKKDGSLDWEKTNYHVARTASKYAPQAQQPQVKKQKRSFLSTGGKARRVPIEIPQKRMKKRSGNDSNIEQILKDASTMGQAIVILVNSGYVASLAGSSSTSVAAGITSSPTVNSPSTSSVISAGAKVTPAANAQSIKTIVNPVTIAIIVPVPVLTSIAPTTSTSIELSSTISTSSLSTVMNSTSIPLVLATYTLPVISQSVSVTLDISMFTVPTSTSILATTYTITSSVSDLPTYTPVFPNIPITVAGAGLALNVTSIYSSSVLTSTVTSITSTPTPTMESQSVTATPSTSFVTPVPSSTSVPSTGAQALIDFGAGSVWAGYVTIGNPPVEFLMDMDTGSSDLWVPSSSCTSSACAGRKMYSSNSSSTSTLVAGSTLNILYGDGSTTSGLVYTDTITVAGLTVTGQTFGAADQLSNDWSTDPMDGLLGMAYQSISQMNQVPFFQNLILQNKVTAPQFSFNLATTGNNSELFLGGMNSNHFVQGSTQWYKVSTETYWIIPAIPYISSVQVVGLSGIQCIVDTGTSVIVAPSSDAATFWNSIPNSQPYGDGYYTYDCSTPPTLSFSFGTVSQTTQWSISADSFNLGQTEVNSTRCVGALIGADIGLAQGVWVLGDAFLENVYSTFDFSSNSVGFSTLA